MILAVLTWISLFVSFILTANLPEKYSAAAFIEKRPKRSKAYVYEGNCNESKEIQFESKEVPFYIKDVPITQTSTKSTKKTLKKLDSLSPRSGSAQYTFFSSISSSSSPIPVDPIKLSKSVDDQDEDNDFSMMKMSSSNVSESFLEDLGLRSRPSTPSSSSSLPSPPEKFRKLTSSSSPSLTVLRKTTQSDEIYTSSDESNSECENIYTSYFNGGDTIEDYRYEFADIDKEEKIVHVQEQEQGQEDNKIKVTDIPDQVFGLVLEYCNESSLLDLRLVDKRFKGICDIYLNFLTNLTFKSPKEGGEEIPFISKYHLSSTMMPFYKNQPDIREIISRFSLDNSGSSWNLMSIFEFSKLKFFYESKIFSNEFIKEIILPQLKTTMTTAHTTTTTTTHTLSPPSLFLLGEALIKSKRFQLFDEEILPILNEISREMFSGIPLTDFLSQNFLNLDTEQGEKVLGSTLHVAIGYNLNFTVKRLVKLQVNIINSKNHYGVTGLLKIIEYLGAHRGSSIQVDENEIDDWIKNTKLKFIQGIPIQENFVENSFLVFEMFLGILNQISETFQTPEEIISFLGFNQEFSIITRIPGGYNFIQRTTTLLHELVLAQQYDLIYYLGFYYGTFIESQLDINPLHMAAEMNDPALVAILLNFYPKIDINALTSSGHTAIGLVVGKRTTRSLKVLLKDSRADPNLNNSVSPLIRSIEIGNTEAVELLLNHPLIDVNHKIITNSKTLSPLSAAVARRRWDVLYLLLRNPNYHKFNIDQDSSVMQNLRDAEKALMKFGEKYHDLIMMVRRLILPTIKE